LNASPPAWSADGNWLWDGLKWNDAISPDGKSRYNGREWKPFRGQRSPMPPAPLQQAAAAPPPPPPPALPSVELPSWVAQSEVERLAQEKRGREELALQASVPQIPPPPELDWRQVGQRMEYSQERTYADWQVGWLSVALFLLLYLFCSIGSLIFIWRTGWRFTTKIIVTVASIVSSVLLSLLIIAIRQATP
jgi:hypothetical protein